MIPLARPALGEEEVSAAAAVLRSGALVQGANVAAFEAALARRLSRRHAIAVSSGTAALHLTLLGLGIGPGDEVIVPAFTFPATANVVELAGATPVLCDIDPRTCNLEPSALPDLISPRTRAIMPVHEFGRPAAIAPIAATARDHGLILIEDAACALGAVLDERPCGSFGTAACISFHPRKILTTGEGGAIVTDDDALADRVQLLRNHGMRRSDAGDVAYETLGLNYRLTEFQAAIGCVQLERLDDLIAERRRLACVYAELLSGSGCMLPDDPPGGRSTYQTYHLLLPTAVDRVKVAARMHASGVACGIGASNLASTAHHQRLRGAAMARGAGEAFRRGLAIPMYHGMTPSEQRIVAQTLVAALDGHPQ